MGYNPYKKRPDEFPSGLLMVYFNNLKLFRITKIVLPS